MTKRVPLTAAALRQAMSARWAAPEYAIMWEVGDATGARATRWADAVIMSLWPSRGLELHGVEIKISRGDWRREAMMPKKAEAVGRFCDRWWIHTVPGVVQDTSELPPLWGLREFDGKAWKTVREAGLNPSPETLTRTFLAALLRRADVQGRHDVREAAERMIEAQMSAFEDRVKSEVARRTHRYQECIKVVEAFEAASGLSMKSWDQIGEARRFGELIKAINASGLMNSWSSLSTIRKSARDIADKLDQVLIDCPLPLPGAETDLAAGLRRISKRTAA